jgi:hypothetical protein
VCAQIPQPPPWGSRIGRSSLNLPMAWSSHGASIPGPPSWDLHSGLPGASVLGSLGPLLWASMLGCLGPVPNLCHPLIRHTRPLCPPGAPLCPGTRGGKEAQWTLSTGEQSEYVHPARGVLHPWSPWDPAQTLDAHQPPNQPRPQISPGPKSAQTPNQPRPQISAAPKSAQTPSQRRCPVEPLPSPQETWRGWRGAGVTGTVFLHPRSARVVLGSPCRHS